jgi:hypothetical protein
MANVYIVTIIDKADHNKTLDREAFDYDLAAHLWGGKMVDDFRQSYRDNGEQDESMLNAIQYTFETLPMNKAASKPL